MATHGNDVSGDVRISKGNTIQRQILGGKENSQGSDDGSDVSVVSAVLVSMKSKSKRSVKNRGTGIQVEEYRTRLVGTLIEETETRVDVDSPNSSHILVTRSFMKSQHVVIVIKPSGTTYPAQ